MTFNFLSPDNDNSVETAIMSLIGECGKLEGCSLHIRPIWNNSGHLARLVVTDRNMMVKVDEI